MKKIETTTDATLVRQYLDGSEDALSKLINRHQRRIYNFIFSKVFDRDITEDIFQDTFIKVIRTLKRGGYNEEGKFLPWVMRISHNLVIDHFRKKSTSVYHPCGTCRMDDSIQNGVVSKRLKVHGAENLWIVDASVFPNITSVNINASVMMMANRAIQLIIDDLKNND